MQINHMLRHVQIAILLLMFTTIECERVFDASHVLSHTILVSKTGAGG